MTALRVGALLRRELWSYFCSPLAWIILTLFLLVQGYSFYLYVELINRPQAPHGAVLQYFFGGSFIYWLFLIFIISAITMRLVAEERRSGTLEVLLTAPVTETQVVLSKYVAAFLFYCFLWSGTLVYLPVLSWLSAAAPLGWGSVAAGYLGTLAVGAVCLAIGLLASVLARAQIVAAVLTFTALSLLLLVGALESAVTRPLVRAVVEYCDLFDHMDDFARGIVDTRHFALYLSFILFCLVAAVQALASRSKRLVLGLCLLASILVMLNYVAARHYLRGDWTSTRVYSLSSKTKRVLESLDQPVQITAFMVPPERLEDSLYHETRELLERMRRQSAKIGVEYVDMDADPTRAEVLAQRYGITPSDLREGVVVLAAGGRSKYVPAAALAEYELASEGTPRMIAFKGESALLGALLTITARRQNTICFTRGHGEAPTDTYAEAGYGYIFDEVKRDGYVTRVLDPQALQRVEPQQCRVLIIGGPHLAFSSEERVALERFLQHEGRLFVLLGPVLDRRAEKYQRVGLEPLLAHWGIEILDNIVVDRLAVPGEQPLMTWATRDGYAPEHPISRAMAGKLTVWPLTREVRPAAGQQHVIALVRTSEEGWAERDLLSLHGARPLQRDAGQDSPGPVSVAVAAHSGGTRLIVVGTERGVLNRRIGGLTIRDYNRDFFLAAVAWLAGEQARVAIGPKPAERVRLAIDERQLGEVVLICVVALPALALLCSLLVWWRRRS